MGLGLGFGLEIKERSKEDPDTTKSLMAVLDITHTDDQWTHVLVKDSPSHYVDSSTVQDMFSSLYCSYFLDTIRRRLYKQWIISVWKGNPRCCTKSPTVQGAYLSKAGLISFTERWWLISCAEKAACMLSLASSPGLPLLQFFITCSKFFACNIQKISST